MESLVSLVLLAVGAALGAMAAILYRRRETEQGTESLRKALNEAAGLRAQFEERASRVPSLEAQLEARTSGETLLNARVAELMAELDAAREHARERQQELIDARNYFTQQFELLANRIFEEKTKAFSESSSQNLSQLLSPLKERLGEFQRKVEDVYEKEGKDRSALAEQVRQLMQLNQMLSQDAQNLALALKGDRKAQGTFGEIILEDILERAGLVRGQHYESQAGIRNNEGDSHVIPDVVIQLPGERNLVIDSKITLPDYRLFQEAADESQRSAALKRHLASVRAHMKSLSQQNYQALYGLSSIDFVVMFVPLEPAFSLAVTNDAELFHDAWEQNVLLVSPSTLLFVVRTVAYLWRQEDLGRNAKAISTRGAELYDKLCGFVADLQKVGERLDQAQSSYYDAKRKLSEGPGNVIRQAEMLKELGVKPSKALSLKWSEGEPAEPRTALGGERSS
jgi:DNA recombination protein RmuC